ncbi:UNKNOWN [Stylonychia lemnae]|uniref:Uncharacterized protein n=1 Tax=Stylonychia lemnae TaxID=5949 RepID=A0A078A0I5_STYLE|nr:UNKNOWN [Stylonychia lemnae]|eukprot:CDW75660.1 UNKNOWN [Stylonychia lemnae]
MQNFKIEDIAVCKVYVNIYGFNSEWLPTAFFHHLSISYNIAQYLEGSDFCKMCDGPKLAGDYLLFILKEKSSMMQSAAIDSSAQIKKLSSLAKIANKFKLEEYDEEYSMINISEVNDKKLLLELFRQLDKLLVIKKQNYYKKTTNIPYKDQFPTRYQEEEEMKESINQHVLASKLDFELSRQESLSKKKDSFSDIKYRMQSQKSLSMMKSKYQNSSIDYTQTKQPNFQECKKKKKKNTFWSSDNSESSSQEEYNESLKKTQAQQRQTARDNYQNICQKQIETNRDGSLNKKRDLSQDQHKLAKPDQETENWRNEHHIKVIDKFKNHLFKNEREFEEKLMKEINANGPQGQIQHHFTSSYLVVRCKTCRSFQVWYKYEKNGNEYINLKFSRIIKQQHVKPIH